MYFSGSCIHCGKAISYDDEPMDVDPIFYNLHEPYVQDIRLDSMDEATKRSIVQKHLDDIYRLGTENLTVEVEWEGSLADLQAFYHDLEPHAEQTTFGH